MEKIKFNKADSKGKFNKSLNDAIEKAVKRKNKDINTDKIVIK